MKRPEPKTEIAIDTIIPVSRFISFYATRDAADDVSSFGRLSSFDDNHYHLFVDARYDFNEVVEYIRHYGDV